MIWRKLSAILLLSCFLTCRGKVSEEKNVSFEKGLADEDDKVSSPRIVGGEEELSPAVVAWQAVFLKNGKFLLYFEQQNCEMNL